MVRIVAEARAMMTTRPRPRQRLPLPRVRQRQQVSVSATTSSQTKNLIRLYLTLIQQEDHSPSVFQVLLKVSALFGTYYETSL
jgi:hypothetical protein